MSNYIKMSKTQLNEEKNLLTKQYDEYKSRNLKLDMSRGKPGKEQLDLSNEMINVINENTNFVVDGMDCRNYGILDGISPVKELFAKIFNVEQKNVIVGGNSSLNLMFDTLTCFYTHGVKGQEPWSKQGKIKFLCPVPGYDRHFAATEYYGFEMIPVEMNEDGPDMDKVEELVSSDDKIKGIWCVPKFSNPSGTVYSDSTVKRLANLKSKAKDFRIFWDNAYFVHTLTDEKIEVLNIMDECKKNGNENLPIMFCSTSKITFAGSGISAIAASDDNIAVLKNRFSFQTVGFDKMNQLRHILFLKDYNNIVNHMNKQKNILKPKFEMVNKILNEELKEAEVAKWTEPKGGYFVSIDVMKGTAREVVKLCKDAGVKLTDAGATFPLKCDPNDSNIRLAPTYPSVKELEIAMKLFCICVKLAAVNKLCNE